MAVAAGAAALSAFGCAPNAEVKKTDKTEAVNPEEGGTWVNAACWHNCGGRCVNKVMVKDGAVVRQKTDDIDEKLARVVIGDTSFPALRSIFGRRGLASTARRQ